MRRDQPVREQVEAQVGVVGVDRRRVEVLDEGDDRDALGPRRCGSRLRRPRRARRGPRRARASSAPASRSARAVRPRSGPGWPVPPPWPSASASARAPGASRWTCGYQVSSTLVPSPRVERVATPTPWAGRGGRRTRAAPSVGRRFRSGPVTLPSAPRAPPTGARPRDRTAARRAVAGSHRRSATGGSRAARRGPRRGGRRATGRGRPARHALPPAGRRRHVRGRVRHGHGRPRARVLRWHRGAGRGHLRAAHRQRPSGCPRRVAARCAASSARSLRALGVVEWVFVSRCSPGSSPPSCCSPRSSSGSSSSGRW